MALMGIREYGRYRGVSHVAVLKALRAGRIHRTADGLIDSFQADRDWARNTHPVPRAPYARLLSRDSGFAQARTVREHYEALLAKHEYERRAANLLDANEVKIVCHRIDQVFRERMLRVPDTVVAELRAYVREHGFAPDERAVHVILTAQIRSALDSFADEMINGPSL